MSGDHPGVVVTLPEIYRDVQETKTRVNAMDNKLDKFLSVNERLDSHKSDISEHDDRIRKLEIQIGAQWVIVGLVSTGIGALFVKTLTGG